MGLRDSKEKWNAYQRKWRRAHPESGKETERIRNAKKRGDPRFLAYYAKYRSHNQEKILARRAVHAALRKGLLVKSACARCGSADVEAHHADYREPLEVQWLCKRHHEQHHHDQPSVENVS